MRRVLALASVLVLATSACKSDGGGNGVMDPDDNGGIPGTGGSMTARIDGQAWTAASVAATFNGGVLAFAGSDVGLTAIGAAMFVNAPGTFTIQATSPTTATVTESSGPTWQASGTIGSGSITVTTLTAAGATGTFTFTAQPTAGTGAAGNRVVTEGVFSVVF